MKQIIPIFAFIGTSIFSCHKEVETRDLSEIEFQSILGTAQSDTNNLYCLLGTGFFRTPSSNNSDSLVQAWIKEHPQAIVYPVSLFGPLTTNNPESKMIYCWVIDKKDTLNNYLVKNGCFPGGTMMRPKTWWEMKRKERKHFRGTGFISNFQVVVEDSDYDRFIDQIISAEQHARKNKLGIWKEEEDVAE